MHKIAQKMLDEFDTDQHIYFALPFVKTMAADFGLHAMLSWVSELLSNGIDRHDWASTSLERVRQTLTSTNPADLNLLDQLAWSHWCCGDVPNRDQQKSICRLIWATMHFVSHENDYKFSTTDSGLEFDGRTGEQFISACQQAVSALNLAYNLDRSTDDSVRLELSNDFTREMERLASIA